MRKVDLGEKAAKILARRAIVGTLDPGRIERARNKGSTRTESKRQLLAAMKEELRRLGRNPTFISHF